MLLPFIYIAVSLWAAILVLNTLFKTYKVVVAIVTYEGDDLPKITITPGVRKYLAFNLLVQTIITILLVVLAFYGLWLLVGE